MSWFSVAAIYFILWWIILFATLPLGLRTQEEEGEVTLGTTASAPRTPRVWRSMVLTTLITTVVVGIYYVVTAVFGYSFEDIPSFVPEFK